MQDAAVAVLVAVLRGFRGGLLGQCGGGCQADEGGNQNGCDASQCILLGVGCYLLIVQTVCILYYTYAYIVNTK